MPDDDERSAPIRLAFLLIDGFALMSYASLVEPFRAANALAGRKLYSWRDVVLEGQVAHASNGAALLGRALLTDPPACDRLFLFAGGDPTRFRNERCFAALRRMARQGVTLGGISGGPYLLARAGLLEGHRATIHWEHAAAFRDEFPDLALETGLYVIDRTRLTCAGGTAGLDLALDLIARDAGPALAQRVAEWFIRTEPREPGLSQRLRLEERYGTVEPHLLRMLAAMERAIEEPLGSERLASAAGLSLRQLERLTARHLGTTIAELSLAIRLDHARYLLRSTGQPVTTVALACGFRTASHFSRRYSARFGEPPSRHRVLPERKSSCH